MFIIIIILYFYRKVCKGPSKKKFKKLDRVLQNISNKENGSLQAVSTSQVK